MFKMHKTAEMKEMLDYTPKSTQICINLENLNIRHTLSVTVPLRDKGFEIQTPGRSAQSKHKSE